MEEIKNTINFKSKNSFFKTTNNQQNYNIAKYLYENFQGEIIATSFFENPLGFLDVDLANNIKIKSNFKRIISKQSCPKYEQYANEFKLNFPDSKLLILKKENYCKIDGIFCENESGYVAFISLKGKTQNIGFLCNCEIAKNLV